MISHRLTASALAICVSATALTAHHFYGPYPVTLKGYSGDKTNSVSYGGQIARQTMEQSLKKLASTGNGGGNAADVEAQMMQYFSGPTKDLAILAPASKDGFKIKQTTIGELSSSANLEGKFYKGLMPAWPGNHTGVDVMKDMISRAAKSNKGFDAENGYDYAQLISKFTMGAVQYSQAVDNYLDEKMTADVKPNDMPYKEGKHYTGKEHSWDEGFGYFGAPAHTLGMTPAAAYDIAKRKDMASADKNGDGVVDLKSEMVFGPAYYAAAFDKSGKIFLINNAGDIGNINCLGNKNSDDIIDEININVTAPTILCNKFINTYKDSGSELIIINISSGAALRPIHSWGTYCQSKAGIDMLTNIINEEHPEIRALSIYPGVVNTYMQLKIRSTNLEEFPLKNKFVEYFKNDELTEPKDVAQKIFYIMSNLSKFSKNMVSVRDF